MTVLITGAANGLGAALTRQAVARGEAVIGIDRAFDTLSNFTEANPLKISADLADLDSLASLVMVATASGPLSTVIFNAAVSATGHFEDIPGDAHQRLIDINLTAPLLMTHELLQADRLKRGATLVFIASLSVQVGYPGAASYAASKAAIANYAASLRKAMRPQGIHVLTVYPGPMQTMQASRHAPRGAREEARMTADDVATLIWRAIAKRKPELVPGDYNRLFALAGKIAPRLMTRTMRKIIYDKLDHPVY